MPDDIPGGDMSSCIDRIMAERDMDEDSAAALCQSLKDERKSEHGNPDELLDAIDRGTGLIADVGVDLASGVDVPAIDSQFVMMKSEDGEGKEIQTPLVLAKDADEEQRIAYAAAMIPREPDKEGDVVATATVEKAAHDFLQQDGGVDTDHNLIDGAGEPVESWILKDDRAFDLPDGSEKTYKEGTWMLGIKWDAEPWQRIKDGELTGLSIYGMAEKVPLTRSATVAKQEIPLADEAVTHLVYESQTAATKASEQMGLDGDIHEHELDGMTVFMPGADHDAFVEAVTGGDEVAQSATTGNQSVDNGGESGDTHKAAGEGETNMGSETTDDGGGEGGETVAELKDTVSDLTDKVETLEQAVESRDEQKDPGREPGEAIQEAADILAEAVGDGTPRATIVDNLRAAFGEADKEDDDDDDDDEEETEESDYEEKADGVEKRTEEANLSKGYDGEATREATVEAKRESTAGTGGLPSYAAAATEGDK